MSVAQHDEHRERTVNDVIMTALPRLANAHTTVNDYAGQTISALGPDILSNTKAMALACIGTLGVLVIVLGTIFMIGRIRNGIGESIMFQLGVIVLGVIVVSSVGIAAALTDWEVDQGVVDRHYVHNEWGR